MDYTKELHEKMNNGLGEPLYDFAHREVKALLTEIERSHAEVERLKAALTRICSLDLKPYENELLYGADKLKMIAHEALK